MRKKVILLLTVLLTTFSMSGQQQIKIVSDSIGSRLTIDSKPFFVKGMNWDYFPVGSNYAYSLWRQPDEVIRTALHREMTLLKQMGVNVIRQYSSIPPKWIKYIYEKYGIYTMINHSFGRYGLVVNGTDYRNTNYCKEEIIADLLKETEDFVNIYKDTPGVLLYLLGNENNYGLFWDGAETEDFPASQPPEGGASARCMYELFNEAARRIKVIDPSHPVAFCNGDLQFLDIIATTCRDVDIFGVNSYRGDSFDELFQDVKDKYGKPLLLTEFGADAFNAVTLQESQSEQASILLSNWQELYMNAAGNGASGNCLGGFTFQFSDGWWKYGQDKNLDIHDTHASWSNGGYRFDFVKGQNNMNEEWFGICAKGKPDKNGLYRLSPRKAYYVLRNVHRLDPYSESLASLKQQFNTIREHLKIQKTNR